MSLSCLTQMESGMDMAQVRYLRSYAHRLGMVRGPKS